MTKQVDILVIIAHPDDAEFGAAGTIAGWIQEGKTVGYVVCTNGDKGSSDRSIDPATLTRIRQDEQKAAARALGVVSLDFLGLPDQQLEETAEFRELIVRQIRIYRPDIVVSTDPYRRYVWHRDHRILGQVVVDACFPYARDHMAYPAMLKEGLEPHKVKELYFFGTEDVNYHVDVADTFALKLAALRCHASQIEGVGGGDIEQWLRKRCQKSAQGSSFELAEAFHRVVMPG
jgi:LmbE family N-acetylglucosaminyl deacetylase